jgi:hypothetical protein
MNLYLQKLFSNFYNALDTSRDNSTGASSINGTEKLRSKMIEIFKKYNINKMFDAGCNDCEWIRTVHYDGFEYSGGDISLSMVSKAWSESPHLNVILHDITTDLIPDVDVLFVRDVTLHLNNQDRHLVIKNWISSTVPWLLITHSPYVSYNTDVTYTETFPASEINWCIAPWNFPVPTDQLFEFDSNQGRCMALWHRNQVKDLI